MYLIIFFTAVLLAIGKSYDCPSASEVILKNMDKIDSTKHIQKIANLVHKS